MEPTNWGTVIKSAIARFGQNRIGDKPRVVINLTPDHANTTWVNPVLKDFVRAFLYEALLTSDPDAAIEVSLCKQVEADNLDRIAGIEPTEWLLLRVSGRGLRVCEPMIEELLAEIDYRREKWLGVDGSNVCFGIFSATDMPTQKLAFRLYVAPRVLACDLLLPVPQDLPVSTQIRHRETQEQAIT